MKYALKFEFGAGGKTEFGAGGKTLNLAPAGNALYVARMLEIVRARSRAVDRRVAAHCTNSNMQGMVWGEPERTCAQNGLCGKLCEAGNGPFVSASFSVHLIAFSLASLAALRCLIFAALFALLLHVHFLSHSSLGAAISDTWNSVSVFTHIYT